MEGTRPAGSGKSSLAFDTIFAEGQRRYVESLSTCRLTDSVETALKLTSGLVVLDFVDLPAATRTASAASRSGWPAPTSKPEKDDGAKPPDCQGFRDRHQEPPRGSQPPESARRPERRSRAARAARDQT